MVISSIAQLEELTGEKVSPRGTPLLHAELVQLHCWPLKYS